MDLNKRFWELDFIRGLAIVLVVIFHFFYILRYFEIYIITEGVLFWRTFPQYLGSTFLILLGISLTLSYTRAVKKRGKNNLLKKYLKRGLFIFSLGLLASIASWIAVGEEFIVFGILHLIGLSIILAYPILHLEIAKNSVLLLSILTLFLGLLIRLYKVDFPWLIWLGLPPSGFVTLDYYPVFPWFGVVLFGIFLGKKHYKGYKRNFPLPLWTRSFKETYLKEIFCFLGRNTLKIYVAHAPVIIGLLYLITGTI